MSEPNDAASRQRSLEGIHLKRGTGRIAAACSVFFGLLSLLGALCFHFPEHLTTPELRQAYSVPVLRSLLLFGTLAGVAFGCWTFYRGGGRRWGFLGIVMVLITLWLGGANIEVDDFAQAKVSFGLDWFVLALFGNTLIFVFVERLWRVHRATPLPVYQADQGRTKRVVSVVFANHQPGAPHAPSSSGGQHGP